ncbi:MAG: response regulator transcription factor [Pseudomonadota bacterium]
MRLLLVEDDQMLGDGVKKGLLQNGYTVDWVKDGNKAAKTLKLEEYDIIVLDIGLPEKSGLDVLREFRRAGKKTPVLILTALETIEDRVKGLDSGADDYLTKPFDLNELCARLRALQRRYSNRAETRITYKQLTLDPAAHTVTLSGEEINLARREFALLHKLLRNIGQVLSREQLAQSLYGWEEDVDSNAVEVHVHNLRKKLGNEYIRTIRGVGYLIEITDTTAS